MIFVKGFFSTLSEVKQFANTSTFDGSRAVNALLSQLMLSSIFHNRQICVLFVCDVRFAEL